MDYEYKTTFWFDFTIADRFGAEAVRDTYDRAFAEWKGDYRFLTELVMVLNHKIWQHHELGNDRLCELYNNLWNKAAWYAAEHLEGDELRYYFNVTD